MFFSELLLNFWIFVYDFQALGNTDSKQIDSICTIGLACLIWWKQTAAKGRGMHVQIYTVHNKVRLSMRNQLTITYLSLIMWDPFRAHLVFSLKDNILNFTIYSHVLLDFSSLKTFMFQDDGIQLPLNMANALYYLLKM